MKRGVLRTSKIDRGACDSLGVFAGAIISDMQAVHASMKEQHWMALVRWKTSKWACRLQMLAHAKAVIVWAVLSPRQRLSQEAWLACRHHVSCQSSCARHRAACSGSVYAEYKHAKMTPFLASSAQEQQ